MHHCVRLFSLLCVQASCSNMGPLPDVKVCFTTNTGRVCCYVYVRCGNFFCLSTLFSFFATLLQTHLYRAAWVSVMNNFFHTYFLYMLEFFLTLSFIPLTHITSFSNLTAWWVKDEATWRIVWKAQCDTSFYGILHLGLIPASCLLTSKHASVRVRVLVFCWSQGYHFLLLQSVPSPMAKF